MSSTDKHPVSQALVDLFMERAGELGATWGESAIALAALSATVVHRSSVTLEDMVLAIRETVEHMAREGEGK
jgi:hypothetical protein